MQKWRLLLQPLIVAVALVAAPTSTVLAGGQANSWTAVASMATARETPAAATGPDGRTYVFGGSNIAGFLDTVEAYDPGTDTWTPVSPMPTRRSGAAAVVGPDGRIYVIGGIFCDSSCTALNTVEAYDVHSNLWSTVASMSTTRYDLGAALGLDGRIYAVGGGCGSFCARNTVEAYDVYTNTWTPVAGMTSARAFLGVATGPDGRIYAVGGRTNADFTHDYVSTVEAYDVYTNSWAPVASMSTNRILLAAATGRDGRIYAIGGLTGATEGGVTPLNTVEAYDVHINAWTPVASMAVARVGPAAAAGVDGRIYAMGSGLNGIVLSSVEAYTPPSIDTTPPVCTVSVSPNTLWPPNHKLVPITVGVSVTDPDDSNLTSFVLQSLTTNEGKLADESQGWKVETPSTNGFLRAERDGNGTGRIYTLTYQGKDSDGNTTTCTGTVTVPHDKGH